MARYTVHIPGGSATRQEALERAIFVRDGWSWAAFVFGPFWLIWHRHWLTGLAALVLLILAGFGLGLMPIPGWVGSGVMGALSVLFGLEGATLRRWALSRAGYREEGLVVGSDRDSLEERYFATALGAALPAEPPARAFGAGTPSVPVLGLFPEGRKHP